MTNPRRLRAQSAGTPPAILRKYAEFFDQGALGPVSAEDALVVGIYLGEGTKYQSSLSSSNWCVTNSDVEVLKLSQAWALRWGAKGFRVKVQIPERDPKTNPEIAAHWAQALSVAIDDVRVYRKKLTQKTVPVTFGYGTVHLTTRRDATRLFHVWRGQLSNFVPAA